MRCLMRRSACPECVPERLRRTALLHNSLNLQMLSGDGADVDYRVQSPLTLYDCPKQDAQSRQELLVDQLGKGARELGEATMAMPGMSIHYMFQNPTTP